MSLHLRAKDDRKATPGITESSPARVHWQMWKKFYIADLLYMTLVFPYFSVFAKCVTLKLEDKNRYIQQI